MRIFDFLRTATAEDRFAKQVLRRLRDRGWASEAQYDRERFALILGGKAGTMFLQNVYRDWSAAPDADRSAQLDRAVGFVFEAGVGDDFEENAPFLLPAIRNRSNIQNQWLEPTLGMETNAYEGAFIPFCDALCILVAVDKPSSIQIVLRDQLSKWSRSLDDALAVAIENLSERSPSRFERKDEGFYVSSYGDFYDASRMLLPQVVQSLPLRGLPVAVAVTRTGLVVAGSEDFDALNAMASFVDAQIEQETRPISYLPLILRNGEWQQLDCSSPQLSALGRLRVKQSLWDHADQKKLLDAHFEQTGRDVFVATMNAIESEGRFFTWATWTSEAATLLPKADAIVMGENGGNRRLVRRWTDIVENCGPLIVEPGTYPQRYFVAKGPNPNAWQCLEDTCQHPDWFPIPQLSNA